MKLWSRRRIEEESHLYGTIKLIDELADALPSVREELFDIRQRSFRISKPKKSYQFLSKSITDLLLNFDDVDLLLEKAIPIVGDYFGHPFVGHWDWNNSPLADLLVRVPHADSFFIIGVSFPRWASSHIVSLMKPERSVNARQWEIELAARKRRWNTYSFQYTTADPVEFAVENGAFAFANYFNQSSLGSTVMSSFIFYFDDEESQILTKIKYPEGRIMDWMQNTRKGRS